MLAALMKKEVLALARDVHGLAALFLMPLIFIIVMSLALKNLYGQPQRALTYAVIAQDDGLLARSLLNTWQQAHGAPQPLPADWQRALRAGDLEYVLVMQMGLSEELALPSLPTQAYIQLLVEPAVDGNLFNALRAELSGAAGELKARTALASIGATPQSATASMQTLIHGARFTGTLPRAANGAFNFNSLSNGALSNGESNGESSGALSGGSPRPSAVQQNVPAWLVFGMFFVVAALANLFVEERSTGALARLQSLGVPRSVLLVSKALPYLGVNALQATLMLSVGVWLMPLLGGEALSLVGISWGALILALAAVSLAAVGMALALACAVRTHAQAAAIGPIANILMAAIGGIMVPKFVMPPFMQRLAELSPMNWGLEALLSVLLRGGGPMSVLPHAARLSGFALLMFVIALALFQRSAR